MRYLSFLALLLAVVACQPNASDTPPPADSPFTVATAPDPAWATGQLQLYPILATEAFVAQAETVAQYNVLGEALQLERFRITEKKPYGRFEDSGAVNTLTVQNKTESPVFLMAGDIVQGGNQDRVIAEDQVIAARSIGDIPVFCVEHGRWTQQDDPQMSEEDKKIYAFRGYYNVASAQLRRSVRSGSQQAVWDKVADITTHHAALSATDAYAGLEGNTDFVNRRTEYERFFSDKLTPSDRIVGFVAVSGNQILGADVFGHPDLLRRQFSALVSGYATDALTMGNAKPLTTKQMDAFVQQLQRGLNDTQAGFRHQGNLVHYEQLP